MEAGSRPRVGFPRPFPKRPLRGRHRRAMIEFRPQCSTTRGIVEGRVNDGLAAGLDDLQGDEQELTTNRTVKSFAGTSENAPREPGASSRLPKTAEMDARLLTVKQSLLI